MWLFCFVLALIISKNIVFFKKKKVLSLFFTTGAYNLGGSPAPTVAKIKNSAYLNLADGSRDDYLGEFSIQFVHVSIFIQCNHSNLILLYNNILLIHNSFLFDAHFNA